MHLLHLFKGLSDPIRLRIVHLLVQQGEVCVCHLHTALALPQSTISRHLNILKHSGLVVAERRGQWVYYRMKTVHPVDSIAELVASSAENNKDLQHDLDRLKESTC